MLHYLNLVKNHVLDTRYLCFCLSETIFLDNFIKKILNFINGTQMLHLYGTYEQVNCRISYKNYI